MNQEIIKYLVKTNLRLSIDNEENEYKSDAYLWENENLIGASFNTADPFRLVANRIKEKLDINLNDVDDETQDFISDFVATL